MSGRSALARGAVAVAVFAAAFAVGNVLGEDERPAAPQAPAKRATAPVGPLRLEPAPALPGLRVVPARPKPKPAPAASAGPGPAAASDPTAGSEGVPVETGGYAAPTQSPPVSSAPPAAEPTPAEPAPPSDPEPAPREVPQASAPTPDPAPIPAVPTPDPAPPGGYGPSQGP